MELSRMEQNICGLGETGMVIQESLSLEEKLTILSDAAKYDVACTSSGVDRTGRAGSLGNAVKAGLCHSFGADGRCISLLKILYTNQCIYDCRYCINRCSNDVVRTAFTPDEICTLTMEFYRRNYIEGLFLSSGIMHNPDFTMDMIYQALWKLRNRYSFRGYIHIKAIPGADPELIERVGYLADRMSVNLELPTAQGLKTLAPAKTREKILAPMRQIQRGILKERWERPFLESGREKRAGAVSGNGLNLPHVFPSSLHQNQKVLQSDSTMLGLSDFGHPQEDSQLIWSGNQSGLVREKGQYGLGKPSFVPAGQSTQMIVGATPENDYQMMTIAEALYQRFGMKRVFYSAFVRVNDDSLLPDLPKGPPLLREHRLYQADWLLRFYGFQAGELLSEHQPNFNILLDPKCDWAIRHIGQFPVEINQADYFTLLRVPGLGVKSAKRIVAARRQARLDFPDLKKLGVVLRRARFFITCSGRMMDHVSMDQDFITRSLIGEEKQKTWQIEHKDSYRQLNLFDDMNVQASPTAEDRISAATGAL